MKVNPASLLACAGVDCVHFAPDANGASVEYPARAAFVTEEAVSAVRQADRASGQGVGADWPDLRYGSVVVSRTEPEGVISGRVYGPGQDAGVYLADLGGDLRPGFTGSLMADCRWLLSTRGAAKATESHRNAMLGILFTQDMVASNPDPDRFSTVVIRDAFLCSMSQVDIRSTLAVSNEEFVRKARADLLRAMITRLDPAHPEGLRARPPSLESILGDAGVMDLAGEAPSGATDKAVSRDDLMALVSQSRSLAHEVFGEITRTRGGALSCALTDAKGFTRLRDRWRSGNALHTGTWADAVRSRLEDILSHHMPDYRFNMIFASQKGQDILGIQDRPGDSKGNGYLYAWPTADRIPVMQAGASSVLSLSRADIPTEAELTRLNDIHRALGEAGHSPAAPMRQPEAAGSSG